MGEAYNGVVSICLNLKTHSTFLSPFTKQNIAATSRGTERNNRATTTATATNKRKHLPVFFLHNHVVKQMKKIDHPSFYYVLKVDGKQSKRENNGSAIKVPKVKLV